MAAQFLRGIRNEVLALENRERRGARYVQCF